MRWWRWARTWLRPLDCVSRDWIAAQHRHEDTRGVDLPSWRTPAEVAQMRRLERKRGLRLAKRA